MSADTHTPDRRADPGLLSGYCIRRWVPWTLLSLVNTFCLKGRKSVAMFASSFDGVKALADVTKMRNASASGVEQLCSCTEYYLRTRCGCDAKLVVSDIG